MKPKFNIADIVHLVSDDEKLFIVSEVQYYPANEDNLMDEYDYEIIQISPFTNSSVYRYVEEDDIFLKAERWSMDYKMILDFVLKDRGRRGYFDAPEAFSIVEANLRLEQEREAVNNLIRNIEIKEKKPTSPPVHDRIRYNSLETINECLDAYNDLTALYESFGDEEYLKNKEDVIKRLDNLAKTKI